ncbi:MAG: extracellular solute-binding protein [Pseudomonadota bacterium]
MAAWRGLGALYGTVALVLAPAAWADTIVSHGYAPFGALGYPPDFPHFAYVNPEAPKGGTISFRGTGASRTFDSLNAFILAGEPAQGLDRLYDTLLARAYDEPDAAYGLLAESIEYPEDKAWVVFRLRPEARFNDGHPVTAEDVAFTLETLAEDGLPPYRLLLEDVDRVEVQDDHTVRIVFAADANTRDLPGEIGQLPILPAHYYAEVDFTRSTIEPPLGSGPYVIDRADPGRQVRYCRAENYWAVDLPVNVGKDNFECVVYEYFADNTAAFEALKSGEYLFHEEFTSAIWATGYDFPALDSGWVTREVIGDDRPSGTQGFWFNLRRPQFQDPRVREAIASVFNFEWSNATLFYDLYGRTDSFWENSAMEAAGLPEGPELDLLHEFRDQLPESVFNEPAFVPSVLDAGQLADRRAVRQASRLLEEAGWSVDGSGMRVNASGERLSLEFMSASPAFARVVNPFIDNLRRIGVDATYNQIDAAQYQQRQENFDYDVVVARFVMAQTPSTELRNLFGSASADAPGSFNLAGLEDPVVDALIDRVVAAASREEMEVAVRALDRILRDRHIWVPNWTKASHWIAYWDVFEKPAEKPPFDRGVDYWWFAPEKRAALLAEGALR